MELCVYNQRLEGCRLRWRRRLERMPAPVRKAGFTLIELSIVLVVIGLIIGAILVGQDLIEAAKMRKVLHEKDDFITRYYTFKLKYNAIPGDFDKAYSLWGSDCTNLNYECNGNRNGIIDNDGSNRENRGEAWMHLDLAGLMDDYGKFSPYVPGNFAACEPKNAIGVCMRPHSKAFTNGLWHLQTGGWTEDFNRLAYDKKMTNLILTGLREPNTGGKYDRGHLLTPNQAYMLDQKVDDGKASTGNTFGISTQNSAGNPDKCVIPNTWAHSVSSADYDLGSNPNKASCGMLFVIK